MEAMTRGRIGRICLLVMTICLLSNGVASAATAQEANDEWSFVSSINRSRASAGLPGLRVVPRIRDYARSHSSEMNARGGIYHDPNHRAEAEAVSSCWVRIGENVGHGGSVSSLHNAFMASFTHRANVLGDYTYVGIGVKRSSSGTIYVTERFMKLGPGCTLPTESAPPAIGSNVLRDPSFELRGQGWGAGNGPGIDGTPTTIQPKPMTAIGSWTSTSAPVAPPLHKRFPLHHVRPTATRSRSGSRRRVER